MTTKLLKKACETPYRFKSYMQSRRNLSANREDPGQTVRIRGLSSYMPFIQILLVEWHIRSMPLVQVDSEIFFPRKILLI